MIIISENISIKPEELILSAIRAGGPGGQHVNKVSTAIQLKFDIKHSTLPEKLKQRLLQLKDKRISNEGIFIIKSQKFRSQIRNKEDAINRLVETIQSALLPKKKRKPTRPTKTSVQSRLNLKKQRGQTKALRKKINPDSDS